MNFGGDWFPLPYAHTSMSDYPNVIKSLIQIHQIRIEYAKLFAKKIFNKHRVKLGQSSFLKFISISFLFHLSLGQNTHILF